MEGLSAGFFGISIFWGVVHEVHEMTCCEHRVRVRSCRFFVCRRKVSNPPTPPQSVRWQVVSRIRRFVVGTNSRLPTPMQKERVSFQSFHKHSFASMSGGGGGGPPKGIALNHS